LIDLTQCNDASRRPQFTMKKGEKRGSLGAQGKETGAYLEVREDLRDAVQRRQPTLIAVDYHEKGEKRGSLGAQGEETGAYLKVREDLRDAVQRR
jgi:hypothetical protein